MKRFFTQYLIDWKKRKFRKPLIVRGARQVGKTYTIRKFGKDTFNQIIEINFEKTPELKDFFQTNDVNLIIQNLELYFRKKIIDNKTLIFIDEIQFCPKAIVTLRYFYEDKPNLHIIAAGSLLDHTLNNLQYSMPVGRVEFAYMYPFNFYEFLFAINEEALVNYLQNFTFKQEISKTIHHKLLKLVREYYYIGGMPEAVKIYTETNSFLDVERIHESIIKSFEFDFSKYGTKTQQNILTNLLRYIPKSVGNKFKYVNFDNSERSKDIKKALNLLSLSRIVHIINNSKSTKVPLENDISKNIFKLVFLDIGLLNHILKLRVTNIKDTIMNNEGNLAEQFVGQELLSLPPYFTENDLYYWVREKRNSEAEIDYLQQFDNQIIPIEVKAGKTGSLKSLQVYVAEKKIKKAIRFNADIPSINNVESSIKMAEGIKKVNFQLISLPVYLVKEAVRFI